MSSATSPALASAPAWRRALSIRARIVLLILAVLIPAAGLVAWLLALDLRHTRDSARDKVTILTDDTVENLRHVIDTSGTLLARLASRPAVQALDPAACDETLAEVFGATHGASGLELRDARGAPVCACDIAGRPRRADPATARQSRAVDASGLTASPPYRDASSGRQAIMLAYPVHGAAGQWRGSIGVSFDLLDLGERLLSGAPAGAVVAVVDGDGKMLLRSSRAEKFVGGRRPVDALDIGQRADAGFVEAAGWDGTRRLFAFRSVPGVGWRVSSGLPTAAVFADYKASLLRSAVLVTAVLVAALALAWQLGASISRPVSRLRRTARRVAEGASDERVDERGPPELRAVLHDFNRMLDALALSQARLQSVFDSTSEAILTADASQRIVFANRAAARTFAMPIERLVGAEMGALLPQRYRQHHRAAVERFGQSDPLSRAMGHRPGLLALRSDGTEFPIEASISHVDVNGQRLYTAVLRDITERQQAEATFAAALASMTDAVCVCDAAGRLVEFNDAFVAFHRFASRADCPSDIEGLARVIDLSYSEGGPAPLDDWPQARARRGESGVGVECWLRRAHGEPWVGSFGFAPLRDAKGTIFGSVVAARDVTALRATKRDLEESHAALRRLVGARDRAQEDERKRIARELHDDLQQTLGAIKMESVIAAQTRAGEVPAAAVALKRIEQLAATALQSTRRIIDGLRPQMLEELGLTAALEDMASRFLARSGIRCGLQIDRSLHDDGHIDPEVATCLYRVAQEALNNIVKHSGARRASLTLAPREGRMICLQIRDDGRGVDESDRIELGSFGLLGMRERLLAVGGRLRIVRLTGSGTLVEAQVPNGGVSTPDESTPSP